MFNITSKYFSLFNSKTTCKLSRAYNKGFSYMFFLIVLQFHAKTKKALLQKRSMEVH